MRLFGRLLMLSVWTPGPREWMCAQRAVPVKAATHTFRPWKASSSEGPRFAPLSCRLCCLGVHIKTQWDSLGCRKQGALDFFPQLPEHMFQDRRGCKASFIYEIYVPVAKLVCGCFDRWLLRMKGGGADCFSSAQLTESLWNENHQYPGSVFLSSFLRLSPRMQIGCKCWTGLGK